MHSQLHGHEYIRESSPLNQRIRVADCPERDLTVARVGIVRIKPFTLV